MNNISSITGKLGFGTLRLPQKGGKVDITELSKMVDLYLESGFNYFDLAHAYMNGECEDAMRQALVERYSRDRYVLCNKLTWEFFKKEEDIIPFFEEQLKACGVSYFDFYLLHALTRYKFEKYKKCNVFEILSELKKQGKIKTIGISFHDKADFLKELLEEYPEIEVVQIQFNYADYNSKVIESRKLYELCREYGKPSFAMESIKGGSLINLPEDARSVFDELNASQGTDHGPANYALRWVAGFENIKVILSGMNNTEQVRDNINTLKNYDPLSEPEQNAIKKVTGIFNSKKMIQCTACRYCVDGCPKNILIPDVFACYNQKKIFNSWNQNYYYKILTAKSGKASECIKCGLCEKACPQSLKIRKLLEKVTDEFEPIAIAKWIDGKLIYFNEGKQDDTFTGLVRTKKGTIVYFENGIFMKNFSGLYKNENGEYLINKGIFTKFTGARWIDDKLTFFRDGKMDLSYTGTAETEGGNTVLITRGYYNGQFNGLISDAEGNIIYMDKGTFDSGFNGEFFNHRIVNGRLATDKQEERSGIYTYIQDAAII